MLVHRAFRLDIGGNRTRQSVATLRRVAKFGRYRGHSGLRQAVCRNDVGARWTTRRSIERVASALLANMGLTASELDKLAAG